MLYQSGSVRVNGGAIGTYTEPFNVDVVKESRDWQDSSNLYIDPSNLLTNADLSFNNTTVSNGKILLNGNTYMKWIPVDMGIIDWTIEAKMTLLGNEGGVDGYDYFISNEVNTYKTNSFTIWFYGNHVGRFISWIDGGNINNYFYTSSVFLIGVPFILTISKIGQLIHFFKDGTLLGTHTLNYALNNLTYPIHIGRTPWFHNGFTNAEIDYLAILLGEGKYSANFNLIENYRAIVWR